MAKKMLIDATHPEETRVVVVDGTQVEEFDFETANKRQLAGNIYLAKITRVEPSLQAAFVDYGGNRHGFLAFAEIHPDYYQIPAADRRALLDEERDAAAAAEAEEDARANRGDRGRSRGRAESAGTTTARDAMIASEAIPGMEVAGDNDDVDSGPVALVGGDEAAGNPSGHDAEEAAERNWPDSPDGDAGARAEDESGSGSSEGDDNDPGAAGDDRTDTASERDDSIESVADEHVAEEISAPRKPRARRYKIQEVIKVRQIMLVQVVKEERGNKGAALTTYLSLAGRYCVLMPNTARGGGISRKITNAADRSKLKDIASELEVPQGAGIIIRTAGSQRTRTEIRRDYEYLMRLWEQIRELTFRSIAPAAIYEEGDLIKRSIRDIYSKDIDEVLVEGERGYRTAKDFMKMIMPSHAKQVKYYADPVPLFARYQVETYLAGMFNPVVQLKSGGYIVIGTTEALVAIDVNSGRATKEGSIEDTAYKTNCEAADEIARQLRLRDLAGLIVIDFIDMDERKNNANVEKRFKDRLKSDRARIQVGRISGFGLLEMSRQRLHPGMLESTTQPCGHCHGTGLIRSDDSLALSILRAIEEEGTKKRSREVLVKAPVTVANYLINQKREHVGLIESRTGMSVRIEADPSLVSPDYAIEKFKTATRTVPEPVSTALSVDASLMAEIDEDTTDLDEDREDEVDVTAAPSADVTSDEASDDNDDDEEGAENGDPSRTRRRRRRRRRGSNGRTEEGASGVLSDGSAPSGDEDEAAASKGGGQGAVQPASGDSEEGAAQVSAPEVAPDDADRPDEGKDAAAPPREAKSRSRSRGRGRTSRGADDRTPESVERLEEQATAEAEASGTSDERAETLATEVAPTDVAPTGDAASGAAQVSGTASDEAAPPEERGASVPTGQPAESEQVSAPVATSRASPDRVPAASESSAAEPLIGNPDDDATAPIPEGANAGDAAASDEAAPAKRRGWWSFGA